MITPYLNRCVNLGSEDNPQKYVDKDLSLECWGTDHFKWSLAITLPSLLFWGLLVPILALVILIKSRTKLFTYRIKSRYGWLYEGLNAQNYCWEFVITYRKIALIMLSVFMIELGADMAVRKHLR